MLRCQPGDILEYIDDGVEKKTIKQEKRGAVKLSVFFIVYNEHLKLLNVPIYKAYIDLS